MTKDKKVVKKRFGKISFDVSNPDKIYFNLPKITKGELVDYYEQVSKWMILHLRNRPISLQRFPDGIENTGFYQKNSPDYYPDWLTTVSIERDDGSFIEQAVVNNKASLVYLANQAMITPHIWLSRSNKPHLPDRLIFDLDPSGRDFKKIVLAAKRLKQLLEEEFSLVPFVMTTGSRGLHVTVPIKPKYDFDEVKAFARAVAEYFSALHPTEYTTEIRKNKREGRIFIDFLRNAYAQTAVAPYAVRPKRCAPVATPLNWEELENKDLSPRLYNIRNVLKRLEEQGDPWAQMHQQSRSIGRAMKRIKELKAISKS